MNKWTELLLGLILVIATVLVIFYSPAWVWLGVSWNFKHAAWIVLKGGAIWFVILIGLLFLMLGISDIKE